MEGSYKGDGFRVIVTNIGWVTCAQERESERFVHVTKKKDTTRNKNENQEKEKEKKHCYKSRDGEGEREGDKKKKKKKKKKGKLKGSAIKNKSQCIYFSQGSCIG